MCCCYCIDDDLIYCACSPVDRWLYTKNEYKRQIHWKSALISPKRKNRLNRLHLVEGKFSNRYLLSTKCCANAQLSMEIACHICNSSIRGKIDCLISMRTEQVLKKKKKSWINRNFILKWSIKDMLRLALFILMCAIAQHFQTMVIERFLMWMQPDFQHFQYISNKMPFNRSRSIRSHRRFFFFLRSRLSNHNKKVNIINLSMKEMPIKLHNE